MGLNGIESLLGINLTNCGHHCPVLPLLPEAAVLWSQNEPVCEYPVPAGLNENGLQSG